MPWSPSAAALRLPTGNLPHIPEVAGRLRPSAPLMRTDMEIAGIAVDRLADLELSDRLGDTPETLAELHGVRVVEQMSRTFNFGMLAALAACVDFWVLVALTVRSLN